ncbi:hypothetical protein NL676_009896 [Syzygium grande]|nr:hypothetical protein NL676_009896 [Syzygium grande]
METRQVGSKVCAEAPCGFSDARNSSKDARERSTSTKKLLIVVVLCVIFMSVEVVGGIEANSLAILTDAAHLLSDVASFAISLFSLWASGWEATPRQSYGFFRVEILGALVSIQIIWLLAGILVYEAIDRLIHDNTEVHGFLMFIIAAFGLLVNIAMALLLGSKGHADQHHGHETDQTEPLLQTCSEAEDDSEPGTKQKQRRNINIQGAYLHVLGDSIQSVGVMIGGAIIWIKPEWKIVDLICTLVFSVIVLGTTIRMLRNILEVLMENTPREIDATRLERGLCEMDEVIAVHELHIWAITVGKVLLACHVKIKRDANADMVLDKGEARRRRRRRKRSRSIGSPLREAPAVALVSISEAQFRAKKMSTHDSEHGHIIEVCGDVSAMETRQVGKVVGGIEANSLAILTDAAHLLSDVASFAISLFSLWASGWEATPRQSYGFFRIEILGALVSIQIIWLLAGILVYEAIDRLINGSKGHADQHHGRETDQTEPLLQTCSEAEGDSEPGTKQKQQRNINIQGAYLHVLGDSIQSVGVMIGGAVIWIKPEWKIVDLICTLVFSVIVLGTTIRMLRNILEVLMENTPREIDATRLERGLCEMDEVIAVHELHIWAITVGKVLLACHVKIKRDTNADMVLDQVVDYIRREYNISHVTIQIEREWMSEGD